MGMTLIEKIIAAHSPDPVKTGAVVWLDLDIRSARDFAGANVVGNFRKYYAGEKVADPRRTFFTFDCNAPANTIPYANNQMRCREFAREQGIRVYDVDAGIGSHVMIDEGLTLPGSTVVGTDSHLNILGAVGAFGQGMGDQDIAFAFRAGRTWFEVPESMRVIVTGSLPPSCSARDLTLAVVGRLGSKGALGRAIEFFGDAVDALDLSGRITLASMVTEMGGIVGLIQPDAAVVDYLKIRSGRTHLDLFTSDPTATYVETIEIDVSKLTPQIAMPPKPDRVVPVSQVGDVAVDSVFVGSCTNGRYEDFVAVAEIVKDRRVAPGVMARAVPATQEIYGRLLKDGVLATLFDAGFIVSNPGCGGCASGQIGMTGKTEVQVSTSNRNFTG
ncbi:3-isopropylmalate dehydratase large subunit, partial [bacterium]|nr:3-isopropylmalate dehydratase large subunit [candidate division CSSED10-310 bacterium]